MSGLIIRYLALGRLIYIVIFWIGMGFSTDGQSGLSALADFSLTVPLKKTRLTVDRGENTVRDS